VSVTLHTNFLIDHYKMKKKTLTTTLSITKEEVTQIILDHFKEKGDEYDDVYYYINDVYENNQPNEYPTTELTEVVLKRTEHIINED